MAIVYVQIPSSALANTITDNLVPQDGRENVGNVELEYNRYPTSHYQVDLHVGDAGSGWWPGNWGDHVTNETLGSLLILFNGAWMINIIWVFFVMNVVEQAFTLDFVGSVVSIISESVRLIAGFDNGFQDGGVWGALVLFILVLVGTWAAYVGIVKRESSRALSGILSSFVIFVCALGFFANADKVLTLINDASADLQNSILSSASSIVSPGLSYSQGEGIAAIRNQMHDILVERPYLLMQYGTSSRSDIEAKGEGRVHNLLSVNPYSEEREEYVNREVEQYDNTMMTAGGLVDRLLFLPLIGISNLLIGGMLLIISCMIIMYQILFLVLVLFAPVPLLLGMIPSMQTAATNWALKVIHAQLMKIGIALLLTILFSVSTILYQAADDSQVGYLLMMVIQILCFVGIWIKRRDLFGLITQASGGVMSSTGHTGQQLNHYRKKVQNALQNRSMGNLLGHKAGVRTGGGKATGLKSRATGIKGRIDALRERPGVGVYSKDDLAKRRKLKEESKERRREKTANQPHQRQIVEGQTLAKEMTGREFEKDSAEWGLQPNHLKELSNKEKRAEVDRAKERNVGQQKLDEPFRASGQNEIAATKDYQRQPSGMSKAELADRGDMKGKKRNTPLKQRQLIEQETQIEAQQDVHTKNTQQVKMNEFQDSLMKEDRKTNVFDRKERTNIENKKSEQSITNRDQVEHTAQINNEKRIVNREEIVSTETTFDQNSVIKRVEKHEDRKEDVITRSSKYTGRRDSNEKRDKHITQWEAQQQINERNRKKGEE
jgi:hypothetical protein